MLVLTRTVRFAANPPEIGPDATQGGPNTYAGSPPIRGLARYYEIDVSCAGSINPHTGYLVNIKDIDTVVRSTAVPVIVEACRTRPATEPGVILGEVAAAVAQTLPGVTRVRWRLSPFYSVEMLMSERNAVLLRQRFDLSASHRLHTPGLSDDENRRLYGKCNNPSGHGHNYQFEPCVAVSTGGKAPSFTLDTLERLAEERIIQRFDHKNLNTDTREFATAGGLNPSVENIARVFFDLLESGVRDAGAQLRSVTVWETDRTSSTYPA